MTELDKVEEDAGTALEVLGDMPQDHRWKPTDEIKVLVNPSEVEGHEGTGTEEVLLTFTAGEMWAAVNVLAREMDISPASALAGCVSFGLISVGYDIEPPYLT